MPEVPVETFVSACQEVVKANLACYRHMERVVRCIFALMIGVGDNIGVDLPKNTFFLFFACRLVPILKMV